MTSPINKGARQKYLNKLKKYFQTNINIEFTNSELEEIARSLFYLIDAQIEFQKQKGKKNAHNKSK